jgi:hypothetical protein
MVCGLSQKRLGQSVRRQTPPARPECLSNHWRRQAVPGASLEFLRTTFGLRVDDVGCSCGRATGPLSLPGGRVAGVSEPISNIGLKPRPGPACGIGVFLQGPNGSHRADRPLRVPMDHYVTIRNCGPISNGTGAGPIEHYGTVRKPTASQQFGGSHVFVGNYRKSLGNGASRTIICEQTNRKNALFAAISVKRPARSPLRHSQMSER